MVGFVFLDFHVFTGARLWDFFSCFSKNSLHVTGMPRNPCLYIDLPGEQSTIASPRTGIQIKFLTSFWSNNSQKVVKLFFFFTLSVLICFVGWSRIPCATCLATAQSSWPWSTSQQRWGEKQHFPPRFPWEWRIQSSYVERIKKVSFCPRLLFLLELFCPYSSDFAALLINENFLIRGFVSSP